jgi:flavin reductase (DIM6/NTAB) family NADH-FMN oxidoreductase RutF
MAKPVQHRRTSARVKRLIGLLTGGRSLRHTAVALRPDEQAPVRAILKRPDREGYERERPDQERDVSSQLFPVSLSPLILGLCRKDGEARHQRAEIIMRDAATGVDLGSLTLVSAGSVEHPDGWMDLMRPVRSSVRCVSAFDRTWHYALAWRQVQRNARRKHAFNMSFADLRALNVYYMMPRPVYLVSVSEADSSNIFPMDLVGPLGTDSFVLALRLTSRSVEAIRCGARLAVSSVPGDWKEAAYQLAGYHNEQLLDWTALPFPVCPSAAFGIPVPAGALRARELQVHKTQAVGSHMLFVATVISDAQTSNGPQLCHVSDMYVRWAAKQGRHFRLA